MRNKLIVLAVTLCFAGALSGCGVISSFLPGGAENDTTGVTSTPGAGEHIQVDVPEDNIDFELESENDPSFSDEVNLDEVPVVNNEETREELFVEKDGYAYRLDPSTLEVIDQPLDIVTHEPVMLEETPAPVVESEPVDHPAEGTYTQTAPTEENRYPNTGIFLEDD